jgi:lipopolysaccharide transport system ATP-binding protein
MSDIAIRFENISKQYRLGLVSTRTLSHDLNRWWQTAVLHKEDPYLKIGETNDRATKGTSEYVWALRDITFDVKKGDVVGIIGKNGAGKSTLLKILSRVTAPTTGIIEAKGKIASLLEVGTGFHPELTGRENIYMNGAILGMTKAEINHKLDEIVDFAGVERYIDTPVKRYSSGMTVRLGFAIAAYLEPDILVVDEVLAVGDAEFQKKAIGKMQDVSRGEGRTVLFVSHNMTTVKNLCRTGIILKDGSVYFSGKIDEVIDKYISYEISNNIIFNANKKREGTGRARVINLKLLDAVSKENVSYYKMGEDILLEIQIETFYPIRNMDINIRLNNLYDVAVVAWRTKETYIGERKMGKGIHSVLLQVHKLNIFDGKYKLSYALFDGIENLDFMENAIDFEILPEQVEDFTNKVVDKSYNLIYTPCSWFF